MGGGQRGAQVEVRAAAEAVEQLQLRGREREPPVFVLAEERDEPPAERLKVGRGGGPALDERTGAAARADPARQHDLAGFAVDGSRSARRGVDLLPHPLAQIRELGLVEQPRGQLEHALHVRLGRSWTHDAGLRLSAEEQIERVCEHCLPGARLARDGREALARPQLGPLDQEQVLYPQLEQHPAGVPAKPDGARSPLAELSQKSR